MAAWPATLPSFLLSGMTVEPDPQQIETAMEVGPPKLRRRTSAEVIPVPCAILLTGTQVSTLETFYLTTLNGGTATFTYTHPITDATATYQFRGRYRLTPIRSGSAANRLWQAAFTLVIVP